MISEDAYQDQFAKDKTTLVKRHVTNFIVISRFFSMSYNN